MKMSESAKDIFKEETIQFWREGYVTTEGIADWNCHARDSQEKIVFQYIEIHCASGICYYVYENEDGYRMFEADFMKKRFTSYHEFFTTAQLATEQRGSLEWKYYVRHEDSVYRQAALTKARELLQKYKKETAHITILGQYKRQPEND